MTVRRADIDPRMALVGVLELDPVEGGRNVSTVLEAALEEAEALGLGVTQKVGNLGVQRIPGEEGNQPVITLQADRQPANTALFVPTHAEFC